ncbi:MAG: ABC transporter permease [Candidatus Niyogibacteria bacterium]|nr:ABC transporter permease [Candidatus Niyogibacteria bacterium]
MIVTTFKRILRNGVISFWRNGWVSFATVLVMVLALFTMGTLLFANVLLSSALTRLEEKVDISVYLKTDAPEDDIQMMVKSLTALPQVKEVEYVSRDEALAKFKERHSGNELIARSLEELGANPLGASVNIRATDPSQYEGIAKFLSGSVFSRIIDKVNYFQNQLVITRLTGILTASRNIGLGATLVLALIALLVTFNTIRLAIYTNREEIAVMRLVGAKNSYIRGPFIVEGAMHGALATFFTMAAFYPLTLWLGPKADRFFGGPNLFDYYLNNFFQLFIMLLAVGVVLGTLSSWWAVKRYLKV